MEDWLSHRVRATPNRTALVRASTGETLDFAGLDAMVDDLAGRLAALGVEHGDHLGMVLETRLAAVCTAHAAERLGAVLVPLGDGLTTVELAGQLDAADVTTLVCSADTEPRAVDAFDGPVCSVDDPTDDAVASLAETTPADVTPSGWDVGDTRLLLFTSGTTGAPKPVRLTQGNLLWSAVASAFRLGLHRDDRWLVCLSLHHMGGLSPVLRMPLYGTTVVLEESFAPGRTADDIGSYDVTCVSLVPTMLKRMLDLRGTLADSLRVVLLGGAPAPPELLERCRNFSIPVHPTYGMTETASQVATATPREAFDHVGTVGRPLFWTSVTVRDDHGERLSNGESGELVVDGPTVSPGYYGTPEATAAAFGPDGLRTGDVGYRDTSGRLFVQGRLDDQIISGGENVHPQEVSDALRTHPQVDDVVVVGLPDEEWGELVGALVVPADDDLTVEELEGHARERLAGFKLPRALSFADELPRTDSGTVRRDEVRRRLAEEGVTRPMTGEDGFEFGDVEATRATDDTPTETTGVDSPDDPEPERPVDPADGVDPADSADPARGPTADASTGRDGVAEDDDATEAFLVGGSDWNPDERLSPDTEAVDTDATTAPGDDTTVAEEPETPDFVREVLPDDDDVEGESDATAGTSDAADGAEDDDGDVDDDDAAADGGEPGDDGRTL